MRALLFPGQGSQVVGMGLELFNNFSKVKQIFKEADDRLSYPLSKIILEGPEDKLQLTENTQPAILTVSYSYIKVLEEEFDLNLRLFNYFAGHSLGEYSALVSANSLKFSDAIFLLNERGKAMQNSVPVGKGSMIAVLGTQIDEITKLINNRKNNGGVCEIANDNANGQVIVSGDKESVMLFQSKLKENKIKCIPLKVSAPFHCSMMKSAANNMQKKIEDTKFKEPEIEIISNVTTHPEKNPEKIKKLLIEQIFSTVRWRESILNMHEKGISNFVEIGPGKVLSGMVKRTIKDANCFSINSITDIKNLTDELKK